MRCAVKKCKSDSRKKPCVISFFSFPSEEALQKQWKSFCCRGKKINTKTSTICMEHFKLDDFENNLEYEMGFTKRRFLKKGAVPSIKKTSPKNERIRKEREQHIQKRENKKTVELLLKENQTSSILDRDEATCAQQTQPEETRMRLIEATDNCVENEERSDNEISDIKQLKSELKRLRKENADLMKSQKKQTLELKALVKKVEEEAKINECNLDSLKTNLTKTNNELSNLEEKLAGIFTKGQIAKLKGGSKRKTWTEEDIAAAITLYSTSAKLYTLLYRKNFPLPAVRTLQKRRSC